MIVWDYIVHEAFRVGMNDNCIATTCNDRNGMMCTSIKASFKSVDFKTNTYRSIRILAGATPEAKIVLCKITGSSGKHVWFI